MRLHSIAEWGSGKSRHIPQFPSSAHSGWNYCCRRLSTALTFVGLFTTTGDGFAGFVSAGIESGIWVPASATGAAGVWPRITISTRRFRPRPVAGGLGATGAGAAHPHALLALW